MQLDLLRVHDKKDNNAQVEQRNWGTFGTGLGTSDSITRRYFETDECADTASLWAVDELFSRELEAEERGAERGSNCSGARGGQM